MKAKSSSQKNNTMKLSLTTILTAAIIGFSGFGLQSCSNDDDNDGGSGSTDGECYVYLFDGDNYKDDNIVVKGPGDFPILADLPGANKDWNDEADSFNSGKNTTVTMWPKTNFEGDSIVYRKGAQEPSIDEPSSMKIRCD